jgi:hypothetical protein
MRRVMCGVALALAACGGSDDDAPPSVRAATDSVAVDTSMALVTRAATVTLGVDAMPAKADSILAASNLTIEEYEALMYRIAADSVLSALYGDAVRGGR